MIRLLAGLLAFAPGAALAAEGAFFSLGNTEFVVTIAFLIFLGVLVYFRVPGMAAKMLDKRADTISGELDEARRLREEAQALLASYQRKQAEVQEQADRLVAHAREEGEAAAEEARKALEASIERRLRAAEDQIASAEAAAIREVRGRAVDVATAAAADVIRARMTAQRQNALIDASIETVAKRLH